MSDQPDQHDMSDLPDVIDAHHHFLDPEHIDYPFLRFLPELARFHGPDDLAPLLEAAGVTQTVAVQASDCVAETEFLLAEAARAAWVAGVVGWVPLADPGATATALDRWAGTRLCGVRHLIHDEPDPDWVVQPDVVASLGLLAARDLAFDLSAFEPRHVAHASTLAELVPNLRIVICHFGMPRVAEAQWEPWADPFARAAAHPNVFVKVSGLDLMAGGLDRERFQPYVDHALEHFGPERMLWASNWPVSLRGRDYDRILATYQEALSRVDPAGRARVFAGSAREVYRLPHGQASGSGARDRSSGARPS